MSAITREEVAHLAQLCRLDLGEAELDQLSSQLDVIVGAFARMAEVDARVDARDVPPTSHPLPLANIMRADEARPCLTPAEALGIAPAAEQQRFRVPPILEEE
jgi:aspartyl-tRNA(Asn)/glutamyl-tRNA(Gln) amidotransferase subunit C